MMGGYLPELLLAGLFILGDLFLEGTAAAVATFAAGVLAWVVSLLAGRGRIALLLEGAVLGGLTMAALLTSFPGGALALTEVVLGGFLLVSGLAGRPALERLGGGLARGMLSKGEGVILSLYIGGGVLAHGAVTAAMTEPGESGGVLLTALLPLFLAVSGYAARRRLKGLSRSLLPRLQGSPGGEQTLVSPEGRVLGRILVTGEGGAASVRVKELDPAGLAALEAVLAAGGYRSLLITEWPGDTLPLEMSGYSGSRGRWLRRL